MYIKYLKKKYQEKWENAYLIVKNARASGALRWALDPGQCWLASLTQLHFATSTKSRKKFLGPTWPNAGSTSVFLPGTYSDTKFCCQEWPWLQGTCFQAFLWQQATCWLVLSRQQINSNCCRESTSQQVACCRGSSRQQNFMSEYVLSNNDLKKI